MLWHQLNPYLVILSFQSVFELLKISFLVISMLFLKSNQNIVIIPKRNCFDEFKYIESFESPLYSIFISDNYHHFITKNN